MRHFQEYKINKDFKVKLLHWANQIENVCFLDSNNQFKKQRYATYEVIVAVGKADELIPDEGNSFFQLEEFYKKKKDWLFGYFSYDLKNEVEALGSNNFDGLQFPQLHFFQPLYLFFFQNDTIEIGYLPELSSKKEIDQLFQTIVDFPRSTTSDSSCTNIKQRISKADYLETVEKIKQHIRFGDIYEMNFCQEFFANQASINPPDMYVKLNTISSTPFSAYYRLNDKYLICASPERFLKKKGTQLISQPIKGTIKRGRTTEEDELLKEQLLNDSKERSENVMIVDLVRNDLSRTAKKGSVKVDELYGIYTFQQVHQMISTISSELRENISFFNAIKNAFPMGSMTGAPKVKAMQLIEKYECTKRGLYSGAVGYIDPNGNFDFNVVIRSILYNKSRQYLSFIVGSAITDNSVAEKEYEECLLKAKAMFEVLIESTPKTK